MEAVERMKSMVVGAKDAVAAKVAEIRDAVREKFKSGEAQPDALELLKEDHELVNALFAYLQALGEQGQSNDLREGLFAQLQYELEIHMEVEEKLLYPALERVDGLRDKMQESFQEHAQVKRLLVELAAQPDMESTWKAQLKVLQEDVKHHVDEEQDEIFPVARKALGEDELVRLGARIEAAKKRPGSAA